MFSVATPPVSVDTATLDSHLEVTVTPSASAFYAGEVFSAVITLRNTRVPIHTSPPESPYPQSQPASPNPVHTPHLYNPQPRSPSTPGGYDLNSPLTPDRPYSPSTMQGWRGHARRPSGHGHSRRSQSLALGKGTLSSQEMVWALGGGDTPPTGPHSPQLPPPLPARRSASSIPISHPHARKISIASTAAFTHSPPPLAPATLPTPPPQGDNAGPYTPQRTPLSPDTSSNMEGTPVISEPDQSYMEDISTPEAGPSRNSISGLSGRSPSPALPDVAEEPHQSGLWPEGARSPPPRSPGISSAGSMGSTSSSGHSPRRSVRGGRRLHVRAPSYHNAYGTSLLSPPPIHPSIRARPPLDSNSTTVLWAQTRLVARFTPSHQHIPPDPLLPLKSRLLHQPIGSGSLIPTEKAKRSTSRWALSFGTGSIGRDAQPSLTGSLFGLAKGLVYGGAGGSLEEERKRVWNTQDLPVLETARSLLGVDIKVMDGQSREFVYTLQLPSSLPPAFKGKALRFSYELVVSLTVLLPGPAKAQRTKEITIPVRVWPNVSLAQPLRTYDVLQPVIQNTELGSVAEREPLPLSPAARKQTPHEAPKPNVDSLASYARQLINTLEPIPSGGGHHRLAPPPSPSKSLTPLSPVASVDPVVVKSPGMTKSPSGRNFLLAAPEDPPKLRPRATSVAGDDELVEDAQRCGEAVEILSRHSPKASYDISQEDEVVAVLTLIKTTYRLGETVIGVVTFNDGACDRRVLKFSAFLETHEVIPEPLLPQSASSSGRARQPELRRTHAEYRTSYALHTARMPFSLDIPSDATPAFALAAGEGRAGGLEWRVRLAFLVASPPAHRGPSSSHTPRTPQAAQGADSPLNGRPGGDTKPAIPAKAAGAAHLLSANTMINLLPAEGDTDNVTFTAGPTLTPYSKGSEGWLEARAETVECVVPVSVLAGNTAFVVRPSVYSV